MNIKDINQDAYRVLDAPLNIKSLSSGSYSPVEAETQKPSFLQRAGSVVDLIFGGGKVGEAIGTLAAKKGLTGLSEEERQYVDQGPTKGEVAGSALRSAALFTPVGRIAGAVSKGLAKTGLTTGAKLLGNIGAGSATGEVFDIATNLESGKTGAETLTPGLGTGIGAGLPLIPPAVKGAGRLVAESLGVSTGAGYGAIKELFKASAKGGVEKKAAIDALRGNTNPEQIVQEARDALSQIRNSRSTAYTRELAALKENTKSYDISLVVQAVKENLNKFGVTVSPGGALDFSRSPIRFNTTAQNDITNVVEVMKDFGSKQGDRTVVGIDSLKRALGDLITPSSEARAFVTAVKDSTRKILSDVPGYDDMAEQYATKSKLISELQKTLSLGDKASIDSSFKKLTTVLRTNNEERRILVEELNAISDGKLVPMIAGQQMSEILPRGIARQIEGFGALGSIMAGFGAPLLKMAIFASPRVVGEMINALGIGARAGNYLLDVLGVKGVKLVSPGDRLLNSKTGQKVEKAVVDFTKNPKAGLSIEDVSKNEKAFKNFTDLSTKLLGKLEGRTTVSKQFIEDLTNSPDLKQPERDLFRALLKDEPDTVNVKTFANKVKSELLPLKRDSVNKINRGTRYEHIVLPDELRGPIANYDEHLYQSPIKTSAGDVHFNATPKSENYFAHTRIEDLAYGEGGRAGRSYDEDMLRVAKDNYDFYKKKGDKGGMARELEDIKKHEVGIKAEAKLAENRTTRRVIEIQSDLFQKGRLEQELPSGPRDFDEMSPEEYARVLKGEGTRQKEVAKLEPYRNTWHERVIREEIKQAAKDGKTKLQFPTGETAMKIEGLGETTQWSEGSSFWSSSPKKLTPENLKVGDEAYQAGASDQSDAWIITDVLGDGKFKAVNDVVAKNNEPAYRYIQKIGKDDDGRFPTLGELKAVLDDKEFKGLIDILNKENVTETFDISGKVDTNNPIYRFYEKEVQKYLRNKYGATVVTDPQGVTWVEVDIKKEMKKLPVEAFGVGGLMLNNEE